MRSHLLLAGFLYLEEGVDQGNWTVDQTLTFWQSGCFMLGRSSLKAFLFHLNMHFSLMGILKNLMVNKPKAVLGNTLLM